MRRLQLCLFVILTCAMISTGLGEPASESDPIKQDIQAVFNQTAAAFDRRDVNGIIQLGTTNAQLILLNGRTIGVREWITKADAWVSNAKNLQSTFKLLSVEVKGDQAECMYSKKHSFDMPNDDGQMHSYQISSRWKATMVKTDGRWRAIQMKEIDNRAQRDGLPIPASQVPKAGELMK
jgi:ketosteroid isomerase-like protein